MKISPVAGIPTIPNPSHTGLSPEKRAVIEALASGKPAPEPKEKETIKLGEAPTSNTQRIKMNVNRSTDRDMPVETESVELQENAAPLAEEKQVVAEPKVGIPDPTIETKPEPEAIGKVSPELAQLAKERRAFQLEKEQWTKEKATPQGIPDGYIKASDLKSNALKVLQEQGVTYEQLTNEILGQPQAQPDFNKFKEDLLKSVDEKLAGKDTEQEESVYTYMKQNVDKMSFSSNDYKLIRETKSQDKVMDLVKRTWREQGEILDETEAMDLIESELRADAKRYAKLIGELEETTTPEEKPQPVPVTKTKTLTNKDSARPVMGRRQRAIAAMLGQK